MTIPVLLGAGGIVLILFGYGLLGILLIILALALHFFGR